MEWKGRRQSDNIEDRRGDPSSGGQSPFGRGGGFSFPSGGMRRGGGGLSIGTIIFLVVIYFIFKAMGIDLMQVMDGTMNGGSGYEQSQSQGDGTPANDDMTAFVRTVLADTEDTWTGIFQASGQTYEKPALVLFSGSTRSGCGAASAASGPFYCPVDRKVYLDTDFFRQLNQQFGAKGEFAEAYVIAHEVGHHVQNILGVLPKFNEARQRMSEVDANKMSVRVELQADCFAGVFAKFEQRKGYINPDDIQDALNAAQQIGDDTLQKRSQGYVVPDSFNHGTSAQRVKWFKQGFDSGKVSACDTFSGPV